ncbi:MAG: hypothetical protein ABIJ96_14175 [Elusimicrobiota bacterium]
MKRVIVAAMLLLHAAAPEVFAALEEVGFTARSTAMGDALTADTGGLAGLTLNPATIGQLRRAEIAFGIRRLFDIPAGRTDINGMNFGAASSLKSYGIPGAVGLSWSHDTVRPVSLDRVLGLTYASKSWREFGPGVFDIGLTAKLLKRGGREIGGSFSKVSVDAGTFYRWGERQAVGFSLLNLNSPKTNLQTPQGSYTDKAPVTAKLGYVQRVRRFTVALDLSRRGPSGGFGTTSSASAGVEHGWGTAKYGSFTGRSGLILSTRVRSWSLGGGWNALGTHVDYAVRIPLSGGSRWSHMVTLSYRFGEWDPEVEYEKILSDEMRYRGDLTQALESAEIKQWKLAEELRIMRGEIEDLQQALAVQTSKTGEAKEKMQRAQQQLKVKQLEEQRQRAAQSLRRLKEQQKLLREQDRVNRLKDEWIAYQKLKEQGVSELVLIDRLKKILRQFKGQGVDLGQVQRELNRLMGR